VKFWRDDCTTFGYFSDVKLQVYNSSTTGLMSPTATSSQTPAATSINGGAANDASSVFVLKSLWRLSLVVAFGFFGRLVKTGKRV